jgi:hypothetical protein
MVAFFRFYDIFMGLSLAMFSFNEVCYGFRHIRMLLGLETIQIVGRFVLTVYFLVIRSLPGR